MRWAAVIGLGLLSIAAYAVPGCGGADGQGGGETELLNVSYDPTRELWKDVNAAFIADYEKKAGVKLTINQSHGGSGTQARAVIDGLDADVVTLALFSDTDMIRKTGLLAPGWADRLPNKSLPYLSTIVFVVRKGNPKGIKDWADIVQSGVKVITPNPKTSGNGKLAFLSAWGSVLKRGETEAEAKDFVTTLYRNTPVLDSGARGSTTTFAQKKLGDVHLTWENEAHLEVAESKGELEIVYPKTSIRAEPHVAVVDSVVDRKKTRAHAEAYLKFLYTDAAQEIIAKHHYRPYNAEVLKKHAADFPEIDLFPVALVAKDWDDAQKRFFSEGGIFDGIYSKKR